MLDRDVLVTHFPRWFMSTAKQQGSAAKALGLWFWLLALTELAELRFVAFWLAFGVFGRRCLSVRVLRILNFKYASVTL